MKKNSEVFASLVIEDQCYVLLQILSWFNTTQQLGVDMKKIGGLEHTGILKAPKKVSIFSEAVLIEQSVTGLYERKIDLLTV